MSIPAIVKPLYGRRRKKSSTVLKDRVRKIFRILKMA